MAFLNILKWPLSIESLLEFVKHLNLSVKLCHGEMQMDLWLLRKLRELQSTIANVVTMF